MPRTEINNNPPTMELVQNMEEKRAKREIANMNERRRMQNINAGFHSLRSLLPQKHDGEKLSKAAILQHTATYIYQLEHEITKLLSDNCQLKSMAGGSVAASSVGDANTPDWVKRLQSQPPDCPSCKRRKYENNHRLDIDSSPINGDGSSTESSSEQEINSKYRTRNKQTNCRISEASALRKQLSRLEKELENERRLRLILEEELQVQNKTTNGRQYQPSSSLEHGNEEVEVASEALEIEMHSCPASPPEMVIASSDHMTTNVGTIYSSSSHYQLGQNNLVEQEQQQQRVQKQNAIALPIDVPFVAPHEIDNSPKPTTENTTLKTTGSNGSMVVFVDSKVMLVEAAKVQATNTTSSSYSSSSQTGQTQILQLVPNNSSSKLGGPTILTAKHTISNNGTASAKNETPAEQAKTSRQNLNTIVEAIRHLEGDFLFNESISKEEINSVKTRHQVLKNTNCATKSMDVNDESTLPRSKANIILAGNIPSNATIMSVSGGQNSSLRTYQTTNTSVTPDAPSQRPQIIQIQRPNVIVANSVEN